MPIDPWGFELVEDYSRLIKEFGMEEFNDDFLAKLPKPNRLMRRKIIFATQGIKEVLKAVENKKPFYALTGIMPSSEQLHFGNKLTIENMKYFQEKKAKTFLLVADLESAATRNISLKEAKKRAVDFHIPAYIALGIDPKKTRFYFQSENGEVKNLGCRFSNKLTLNEYRAIYGQTQPSRIVAGLIQAGDILFPQTIERMPGIVPVGADQSPHIRMVRDIARRTKAEFNFFLPAAIYHRFTPSLDGSVKMSKSRPGSCISIPEDPKTASKKIMNALTGGRETLEEQKKSGGQPQKCMVFELLKQHLIEDDKKLNEVFADCTTGKLMCGDCKKMAAELMEKFLKDFNKKFVKAKKQVKKIKFIKN